MIHLILIACSSYQLVFIYSQVLSAASCLLLHMRLKTPAILSAAEKEMMLTGAFQAGHGGEFRV